MATAIGAGMVARSSGEPARAHPVVALSGQPPRPIAAHRSAKVSPHDMVLLGGIERLLAAGRRREGRQREHDEPAPRHGRHHRHDRGRPPGQPAGDQDRCFGWRHACPSPSGFRFATSTGIRRARVSHWPRSALCSVFPWPSSRPPAAAEHGADARATCQTSQLLLVHARPRSRKTPNVPPLRLGAEVTALQAGVDQLVSMIDGATATSLQVAFDPARPTDGGRRGDAVVSVCEYRTRRTPGAWRRRSNSSLRFCGRAAPEPLWRPRCPSTRSPPTPPAS